MQSNNTNNTIFPLNNQQTQNTQLVQPVNEPYPYLIQSVTPNFIQGMPTVVQAMQRRQDLEDEAIQVSPIIRRRRTMLAQRPPQATGTTRQGTPPPPQIDLLTEMQLDRRDEAFVPSSPQYRRRLRGG